jgi:hypothetical protein
MMKLTKLLAGFGLTATILFAHPTVSPASSVLLDQGNTTLDPATHLQWLDLTKTQPLGADDVLGNVGVSYIADGWRYATETEITRLWSDAGFTPGNYGGGNPPLSPEITAFQNLLGVTEQHLGGIFISAGLYVDNTAGPTTEYGIATVTRESADDGGLVGSAIIEPAVLLPFETGAGNRGSYLVRTEPVAVTPLPAGLPMFAAAIGLLGVAGRYRRSRHLPSVMT